MTPLYCWSQWFDPHCDVCLTVLTYIVLLVSMSWPPLRCLSHCPDPYCALCLTVLTPIVLLVSLAWPPLCCLSHGLDPLCAVGLNVLTPIVLSVSLSWSPLCCLSHCPDPHCAVGLTVLTPIVLSVSLSWHQSLTCLMLAQSVPLFALNTTNTALYCVYHIFVLNASIHDLSPYDERVSRSNSKAGQIYSRLQMRRSPRSPSNTHTWTHSHTQRASI